MSTVLPNGSVKPAAETWFYPVATVGLLVLTVIGFQRFYFHNRAKDNRAKNRAKDVIPRLLTKRLGSIAGEGDQLGEIAGVDFSRIRR